MTCLDVSTDDMGGTIYKIKTELIKADDTPLASREYNTKCKDGKFSVDLTGFDNPDVLKQFRDLSMEIYTGDGAYPKELSVGQSLPNLISVISIPQKGTTVLLKTNWKVESNESVTVPAGTFDCFKITYDLEIKSSSNNKFKVSEYVAVGVGNIKSETFNTKGKLKSSAVLYELVK